MSYQVCFKCGTYVEHYTTPPQYHPCGNKEHKLYDYQFEKDVPDKVEKTDFVEEKPEGRKRSGEMPDVAAEPQKEEVTN